MMEEIELKPQNSPNQEILHKCEKGESFLIE